MKSITTRLFLVFAGLMVGQLVVSTLVSALYLKPWYVATNRRLLAAAAGEVDDSLHRGDVSSFIRTLDRARGISVMIADADRNVKNSSFSVNRLPAEVEALVRKAQQQPGSPVYQTLADPEFGVKQLAYVMRLSNGEFLVLRRPMRGIDESATMTLQFFLFSGFGIMLAGSAVIFIFSRRLTRPVVEMSRVADGIANLDFAHRAVVSSRDEMGVLAQSINRMAERLDDAVSALRADVERRKRLVRDMSHELKTPIGVIKGYAEALKFGLSDDTEQYCTIIAAEADRMDEMVKDLLNLSLLESGGTELERVPFAVRQLLEWLMERYTPVAAAARVTLTAGDPEDNELHGDPTLIERAVGNFVANALRHTPAGGRVEIAAQPQAGEVSITVFNSGSHIAADQLPRIWDVFYRADHARRRDSGGHGLGLSIARRIAELHGGRCGVENTEDGVIFSFTLPNISR